MSHRLDRDAIYASSYSLLLQHLADEVCSSLRKKQALCHPIGAYMLKYFQADRNSCGILEC